MLFHQFLNSTSNLNFNTRFYENDIWEYHFHKNLEMIYVIEGTVNCIVNEKKYALSQGEFGLCLPYDFHSYTPCENTKYWVVVFSEDFVRYFSKKIANKIAVGYSFCPKKEIKDYITSLLI